MSDENTPSNDVPSQVDPEASPDRTPATGTQPQRSRVRKALYEHLVVPLVVSKDPPWFDARGAAVGFFIALGFPLGSHTVSMVLLRLVFRFNLIIAYAFSWILNPFTIVPIYYGAYKLGGLILGRSEDVDIEGFRQSISPLLHSKHFLASLKAFVETDLVILERWAVGAVCIAAVTALIGYFVVHWVQTKRQAGNAVD
jgi:uncharacterized protein